jgi:tetratricopeptide (TPR) repeat protein
LLHESERYQDMLAMTQAAFADAQSARSDCEMAQACGWKGLAQAALGLIEEAIHTLDEGLVHARRGDDQVLEGVILANIGLLRIAVNDLTHADADLSAAQVLATQLGDHFIRAIAVAGRGRIDYLHDNKSGALVHFSEATSIYRTLDMQYRVGNSLVSQAIVEVVLGETQAAAVHLQEALRIGVLHGLERIIGESMLGLAGLHLACGDAGRARTLLQSSERIVRNPGSMYDILKPAHATWSKALRMDDSAPPPPTAVQVSTAQAWTSELVTRLGPPRT